MSEFTEVLHLTNISSFNLHILMVIIAIEAFSFTATAESVEQEDTPRVVMLATRDSEEASLGVIRAVKGHLSGLSVRFEVEWKDKPPESLHRNTRAASDIADRTDALIVFWCDLSLTEDVYLFISDRGQRHILVRRLDVGEAEVRYESLAVIVYSVVDAILRGGKIGVVPPEPPPEPKIVSPPVEETETGPLPEVPEKTPTDVPAGREFSLQLGYDLRAHSEAQVLLNGFYLGASLGIIPHLYFFGGYTFSQPVTVDSEQVQFELQPHPIAMGIGLKWGINRFRIGAALSFAMDYVVQETKKTDGVLPIDNEYFIVSTSPIITSAFKLFRQIYVHLKLGVQFDLTGVEYKESDARDAPISCTPWRVIPWVQAGFIFFI